MGDTSLIPNFGSLIPGADIEVFEDGKPVSNPRIDTGTLSAAMLVQIASQIGVISDYYRDRRSSAITRSYPTIVVTVPAWHEFPVPVQGFSLINDGPDPVWVCVNTVTPYPHQVLLNEEHHIAVETHEIYRVVVWCSRGNTATIRLETIE